MLIQALAALCVAGILVLALLTMINVLTIEETGRFLARGVVALVAGMMALCIARQLMAQAGAAMVAVLKPATLWLGLVVLALFAALLVTRVATRRTLRFTQKHTEPGDDL